MASGHKMIQKYKLHFFAIRGRGEPIRMMFHYAKQPFEDNEVSIDLTSDEWLQAKRESPFGQLPFLEVTKENGEVMQLAQFTAIMRYLAKQFELEARCMHEQALCDMYSEYVQECLQKGQRYFWTKIGLEPAEKEPELRQSTFWPTVKVYGDAIEKQLKKNGTGYIVGKKMTWTDIHIACFTYMYMQGDVNAFKEYPLIGKHQRNVFSKPGIKEYVKTRPSYPF